MWGPRDPVFSFRPQDPCRIECEQALFISIKCKCAMLHSLHALFQERQVLLENKVVYDWATTDVCVTSKLFIGLRVSLS